MLQNNYLQKFKDKNVLVIGDVMLDRYIRGVVNRISPEAPIQVVDVLSESDVPGGASNVAHNIASLGGSVQLFGVVGKDYYGQHLISCLESTGVDTTGLVVDEARQTTTKVRVLGSNQQIVRFDYENRHDINGSVESKILKQVNRIISQTDAIVISDYAKGLVSHSLLRTIMVLAELNNIPVVVDPKPSRGLLYRDSGILTPNQKEAFALAGTSNNDPSIEELESVGKFLVNEFGSPFLITRGSEGMSLFERNGSVTHMPAFGNDVVDIVGAGDTVVAVMALSLGAGASYVEAADIANCAAAVVVNKVGTAVVTPDELADKLNHVHA